MAATKTKNDLSDLLGIPVQMDDVDASQASAIKSSRGRQEGEDIKALRDILRESMKSGKAKVFNGITDTHTKDTLVRKVRQAGNGAGEDGSDVKVSTSYNKANGQLFWGPKSVIDQITGKSGTDSSSDDS